MERKKYEQLMGKNGNAENILDYDFNRIAGRVLKEKRLEKNISLDTLSKKINKLVSRPALYRYENGSARIKNNVFVAICHALGCEPVKVFSEIHTEYMQYIYKNMNEILERIEDKD